MKCLLYCACSILSLLCLSFVYVLFLEFCSCCGLDVGFVIGITILRTESQLCTNVRWSGNKDSKNCFSATVEHQWFMFYFWNFVPACCACGLDVGFVIGTSILRTASQLCTSVRWSRKTPAGDCGLLSATVEHQLKEIAPAQRV